MPKFKITLGPNFVGWNVPLQVEAPTINEAKIIVCDRLCHVECDFPHDDVQVLPGTRIENYEGDPTRLVFTEDSCTTNPSPCVRVTGYGGDRPWSTVWCATHFDSEFTLGALRKVYGTFGNVHIPGRSDVIYPW